MKKYIVFGSEHYNPLGIIRSLGENGYKVDAIVIRGQVRIMSKSKYITRLYMVDSIEEGYEILIKWSNENDEKSFIFTADDRVTSFLDLHYDELSEKYIFYNAGKTGAITNYMNKDNIYKLAQKHGFNVLQEQVVSKGYIPPNLDYPVITKAVISTQYNWKQDMYICNSEQELKNAYEHIKSEKIIIQKYIKKKNELCMEGFSIERGKDIFIAIACTYNYLLNKSYSPYMTVKNFNNNELYEKLKGIFEDIGYEGIFEIEFLIGQDDKLYFGEINFRNSTWSYAATCAGMNLPLAWSESMQNGGILNSYYKEIPKGFNAMVEFADFNERVRSHKINMFQWLKDVKKCDCLYYYGKNDSSPFYSYAIYILNNKIKKMIRRL